MVKHHALHDKLLHNTRTKDFWKNIGYGIVYDRTNKIPMEIIDADGKITNDIESSSHTLC